MNQQGDLFRVEISRAAETFPGKKVIDVIVFLSAKKDFSNGRPIWLLGSCFHRIRHEACCCLLEDVFLVESADLPPGRQPESKINDPVIQKGEADFQRVGHGRPVALGGKKVVGKKHAHLQVLGPGQHVPCFELRREAIRQDGQRVVAV